MARDITGIMEITATLTALTPLHVGAAMDDLASDMPVACDGRGQPYIPGTSLAGACLAWWKNAFGKAGEEDGFWGTPTPKEQKKGGSASYITIGDAYANEYAGLEIRDGVGIDRHSGTAADGIKYDREVLPVGTLFNFYLRVEMPKDKARAEKLKARLAALIAALQAGDIRIGAAKTRGLGKMKLEHDIKITQRDYGSLQSLLDSLDPVSGANAVIGATAGVDLNNKITFRVTWKAVSALLSAAGVPGHAVDIMPVLRRSSKDYYEAYIPGSGIKGAIRSHGERIIRTLLASEPVATKNFLVQVAGLPLIDEVFGAAKNKGGSSNTGLGALTCEDCVISPEIDKNILGELSQVDITNDDAKSQALQKTYDKLKPGAWKGALPYQHVAIDRWTGGAAAKMLYSVMEPPVEGSKQLELSLDLNRLAKCGADDAGAGFVLLLLREMALGRIPLGFGVNRGRGTIQVESVEISGGDFAPPITIQRADLAKGDVDAKLSKWADAWAAFAKERFAGKTAA